LTNRLTLACAYSSTETNGASMGITYNISLYSTIAPSPSHTVLIPRCVQATLSSGVGCSSVQGDTNFHVFTLIFNGNAVGDQNITRFRVDFVDQALTFAPGSSQSSNTGMPHFSLTKACFSVFL
jgi:hypothetical protein